MRLFGMSALCVWVRHCAHLECNFRAQHENIPTNPFVCGSVQRKKDVLVRSLKQEIGISTLGL